MDYSDIYEIYKIKIIEKRLFNDLTNQLFGWSNGNFKGGCGDLRTDHETMFALLYPHLNSQVSFGTGKGGYKEYGFKRVIVDFYDSNKKIAYEIDGDNHKRELQQLKDRMKELFLQIEYGIRTIRFTNKEVEEMLLLRIKEISDSGGYDHIYKRVRK